MAHVTSCSPNAHGLYCWLSDAVAEAAAAAPQGRDVNGYSHPDMHGSSSQGSALSVYLADVPADVRPRDVYAAFDGLKVMRAMMGLMHMH